jgi:uridine kinase
MPRKQQEPQALVDKPVMQKPVILGIAGCSGSGKTTLAKELTRELTGALLPLDFYYRDLGHLSLERREQQNFDHPDSLEHTLLTSHVATLAKGHAINAPVYDFAQHTRVPGKAEVIEPAGFLIVEGILALHYEALRALYDFSIFVEAPPEVCLARRIHRDVRERGRTDESVRAQYEATALPMALEYVLPSAGYASLVVDGCEALDWSVEQVIGMLRRAGHLPRA